MISRTRTFEEQFDPPKVAQIAAVIERLQALRSTVPGGATRYYLYEAVSCLQAGLLLGALHLIATSLELMIRAKISISETKASRKPLDLADGLSYQQRLEESRKLRSIKELLQHLSSAGLFRTDDVPCVLEFYERVRTPLSHGLLDRLAHGRPVPGGSDIFALLGSLTGFTTQSDFEGLVERESLNHIETVIRIFERNAVYRTVDGDG